jgi:hypothetical protein
VSAVESKLTNEALLSVWNDGNKWGQGFATAMRAAVMATILPDLQDAERRLREAEGRAERFKEALVVIAEGRGPFSTDRYEHACNVIESMKEVAMDALADPQAQGREAR